MKKKLIFIIYGCADKDNLNPNAACIKILSEYLQNYFYIDIITNNDKNREILCIKKENLCIHAFPVKSYHNRSVIDIESDDAKKYLIENVRINDADLCIAVSYPFMPAIYVMNKLYKLNPRLKKIIYEFDPLAYNGASNFKLLSFIIRFIYEFFEFFKADQIWLTRELFNQYNKNLYKLLKRKFFNVGIPLLDLNEKDNNRYTNKEGTNRISFVYSGTFYDKIRKPDYLMELMKHIIKKYDCELHIYGTIIGQESLIRLNEAKKIIGDKLILHGKINRSLVPEILSQADILINVSNSIPNQLPSKVFEYISTGKPIINISSIDNDSSRFYLDRYPLTISINELWDERMIEENVNKIIDFCHNNKDKIVSNNILNDLYSEFSVNNIVDKLRDIISELFNKM